MHIRRPSGLLGFTVVWTVQAESLLRTSMSACALTIRANELTGKATALALQCIPAKLRQLGRQRSPAD